MAKKKPEIDRQIVITAIAGITLLDSVALICGHNGIILSMSLAAIAGLAGWTLPTPREMLLKE